MSASPEHGQTRPEAARPGQSQLQPVQEQRLVREPGQGVMHRLSGEAFGYLLGLEPRPSLALIASA